MRKSVIKEKLRRDEPTLTVCLHLTDPSVYELTALLGFDCIWMDMEHHAYSVETAGNLMRAARTGNTDIIARPAKREWMRALRMLEAGATGLLYPRCSDAEEAAELVKWCKFAPLGERGFDGGNPDMPYCTMEMSDYVRVANEETFIAIQLEQQSAVDQAEAIGAVEGVDILFMGPADFSVLEGFPGDFNHPKVQKAIETIAQAAKNTGKHWGMPAASLERAQELMDLGARFICHGADIVFIKNAMEQIQDRFQTAGFTFGNLASRSESYMEKA